MSYFKNELGNNNYILVHDFEEVNLHGANFLYLLHVFSTMLFIILINDVFFLLVLLVKGFLYLKSTWRKVSSCLKQCFYLVCHPWCGCSCGQQENANEYILIQDED